MALTKCTVPDNVIGSLGTTAQERGLTTQEFKNKFDEIPEGIKEYINNVLTTELDNYIADYMSHKAESVTDTDGAHGLKIESGYFTPTIYGYDVAGAPTYTTQQGYYYKIGKIVLFGLRIAISTKGGMSGRICIGGLPFQTTNKETTLNAGFPTFSGITFPGERILTTPEAWPGASFMFMRASSNIGSLFVDETMLADATTIVLTGSYISNA